MTGTQIAPPATDRARAAFLGETLGLLWPAASPDTTPAASLTELMVLPRLKAPRLVVPLNRKAAATAVRRYGEPRSARSRIGTRGLSLLLRSGLGPLVLRDRVRVPDGPAGIDAYLSDVLDAQLTVSMYVGAPRANRKPVLHLFAPDGSALGVVKVGITPLTRELVNIEGDALQLLADAGLTHLTVPQIRFRGVWNGMPVLVLEPLPVDDRRVPLTQEQRRAAVIEIAGVGGWERVALANSRYLARLRDRIAAADPTPEREQLAAAVADLATRAATTRLTFGSWHGDWSPWNMANIREGLLVWDWERFEVGVPFGFDVLHNDLQQQVIPGGTEPLRAARECVQRAASALAPIRIGEREARVTALVYLAELTTRYLVDRQADLGGRLSDANAWLIPALRAETSTL